MLDKYEKMITQALLSISEKEPDEDGVSKETLTIIGSKAYYISQRKMCEQDKEASITLWIQETKNHISYYDTIMTVHHWKKRIWTTVAILSAALKSMIE